MCVCVRTCVRRACTTGEPYLYTSSSPPPSRSVSELLALCGHMGRAGGIALRVALCCGLIGTEANVAVDARVAVLEGERCGEALVGCELQWCSTRSSSSVDC